MSLWGSCSMLLEECIFCSSDSLPDMMLSYSLKAINGDGNIDGVPYVLILIVWLIDHRNPQQSVLRWRCSGYVVRRTSLSLKLICSLLASSLACSQHSMSSRTLKLASRMTFHSSNGRHSLHVLETVFLFFWTLIVKNRNLKFTFKLNLWFIEIKLGTVM